MIRLPGNPQAGEMALILLAAVALDLLFGEPPNAIHPVAWMGRLAERWIRRRRLGALPTREFLSGLLLVLFWGMLAAGAALALGILLSKTPVWMRGILLAIALKPLFAIRALPAAANVVDRALSRGDIPAAQFALRALVSRNPNLPEPLIVSATIESVAENVCDSVVAPLFYFSLFGLPGAAFYRAVNTLDAMIGYRGDYEWYGKAAARLDDALNYVPGRVSGVLLCAGAAILGCWQGQGGPRGRRAWRVMWGQARQVASPNAGWSMAAMAGALGVCLEKTGHYRLCGGEGYPRREHIRISQQVYGAAVVLWLVLLFCLFGIHWVGL